MKVFTLNCAGGRNRTGTGLAAGRRSLAQSRKDERKPCHLLVRLKVFNTEQMNQAVFAFRRYEDASLRYTGIESHEGLTHYGLYDTVVARE